METLEMEIQKIKKQIENLEDYLVDTRRHLATYMITTPEMIIDIKNKILLNQRALKSLTIKKNIRDNKRL